MLLDTLSRLMAPILPFTAEEIWQHLPASSSRAASIHLALLPDVDNGLKDDALAERWERLLRVRAEVTKALEAARTQKLIGHALDAEVILSAGESLYTELSRYAGDLRSLFIVSAVSLLKDAQPEGAIQTAEIPGLSIRVQPASGRKCERCWVHEDAVGESSEHPTLCRRCRQALAEIETTS
jgi:isoleucyl-tRNA synthetase